MRFTVDLSGNHVGFIEIVDPVATFTFADEYIESSDRHVLGLAFEEDLLRAWTGINRMPSWFSNLLPEGGLRTFIGTELRLPGNNITSVRTESALFGALGADLPGAVSVIAVEGDDLAVRRRLPVRSLVEDAPPGGARQGLRFSVAGVGIKFSMMRDGRQFLAPAHGFAGNWLLKLPDRSFPRLPLNEFAMMSWAHRCGLDVPDTLLVDRADVSDVPDYMWAGESQAYAIRRFDREPDGGKVHIEDLAQVRGLYPEDKYVGNFETVANLVYRGRDHASLEEFIRRLTFSIAIGNDDAHLKNWSLIYPDGRKARISPAYDLVTAAAYPDAGLMRDIGLKLAGSRRYDHISLSSFSALARRIGAPVDAAEIARQTVKRMGEEWDFIESILEPETSMIAPIRAHFTEIAARLSRNN